MPSIHPAVQANLPAIQSLCEDQAVERLELFGSATDPSAVPKDFDFLVEFDSAATGRKLKRFLRLAEGLETILGKPVDLLTMRSLRNPFFIRSIQKQRITVYDQADNKTAV